MMFLHPRTPLRALFIKARRAFAQTSRNKKSNARKSTCLFAWKLFANQIEANKYSESQTTPIQPNVQHQ